MLAGRSSHACSVTNCAGPQCSIPSLAKPYNEEQTSKLEEAYTHDKNSKVVLEIDGGKFEVRFGSAARSYKMPVLPVWAPRDPRVVQVNLKSNNTRVVRRRVADELKFLVLRSGTIPEYELATQNAPLILPLSSVAINTFWGIRAVDT